MENNETMEVMEETVEQAVDFIEDTNDLIEVQKTAKSSTLTVAKTAGVVALGAIAVYGVVKGVKAIVKHCKKKRAANAAAEPVVHVYEGTVQDNYEDCFEDSDVSFDRGTEE